MCLLPKRKIAWPTADPKRTDRQPQLKLTSQRASIFSPQPKMIIVALPKQTIAWAATGAPMAARVQPKDSNRAENERDPTQ
jgi:hypothetical protein